MKKKYVLSDGMRDAAVKAHYGRPIDLTIYPQWVEKTIEAVLRYISENPIVPTDAQIDAALDATKGRPYGVFFCRSFLQEFQRIMFLAPEPETPQEIEDLVAALDCQDAQTKESATRLLIEAYQRGAQTVKV